MNNDTMEHRKKSRSTKGIFLVIVLAVLTGLAYFVFAAKDEAEEDAKYTFECNAERVTFLNEQGWIVEPDPQKDNITIPAEFNDSYNEYNELQKSQGFDLTCYAGKEVTRYTYKVLNYPDITDNIVINLLFDDHRMIGADITYNSAENGFTKALINEWGTPHGDIAQ